MSTDNKYGQCLLFEAPEDFQRLWYILEAEILRISLSKATLQLIEGQFDDTLETIHSIWAPSPTDLATNHVRPIRYHPTYS